MTTVLVDTDVVSFVFKNHPLASRYLPDLMGRTLAISFMTLAELYRWALQSAWGMSRWKQLEAYLDQFVILPYSKRLCSQWAEVMVVAQANGYRIDCADAWIAASALLYQAPLLTHNRNDYLGVPGLKLICHST